MTLKVDGTNGVLQAYDYQVLTTGFSYTFASGTQTLVINPAGTLATGTITMPASPVDGMVITVVSTQQVTAVTVAANSGQTLVGAAVQLIPNQPLSFVYRLANTTWYPFAGGAGRASSLVSGTAVASTSGTSIDFTGIPSWAKRVTVIFNNVSTTGGSPYMFQIGSGSFNTTGYVASTTYQGQSTSGTSGTNGFFMWRGSSGETQCGSFVIHLVSGTTYVGSGVFGYGSAQTYTTTGGGSSPAIGAAIDRVRITTYAGTDTFDLGSVNIMYE